MDETQPLPQAEASISVPSDMEIEKNHLQLSRIDPSKFEYFYDKYYNTILRFVAGEVNDPDIAQDITQDVFSIAMDRLDKFRWQGYSFGAWLFQIARNLRAMEGRRHRQNREVAWNPDQHDREDPVRSDDDLYNFDDNRIMELCINNLDPTRREVFKAYYWTGLKTREIAIVMKMSESNVKNHLQRGRRQLRRWLVENGLERGLSAGKIKLAKESTLREEGWNLLEGEEPETS